MNFTKTYLFLSLIALVIIACTSTQKKESQPVQKENEEIQTDSIVNTTDVDTVRINLQNGRGHLKVRKQEQQRVYFVFDSQDFNKLSATLSSNDSIANIRFTQIVMPDGKMDGPFGRTITYELPVNGNYILIAHENEMAGEPWGGDFEIDVTLSK